MILYDYFRSSASYRVRIALALKQVECEIKEVHLVHGGGEQFSKAYSDLNPQMRVPTLVDGDVVISQSLAIIDYLDQKHEDLPLVFGDPETRARIMMITQTIASDIHPLDNLSVLKYLKNTLGVSDQQKLDWYHHWIKLGFSAIETWLSQWGWQSGFCFGDYPSLADICLVPQVYNAHRFEINMSAYPQISCITAHALSHSAFSDTAP